MNKPTQEALSETLQVPSELEGLGHQRMSFSKAIRAKCLNCCNGHTSEVLNCLTLDCPLLPYRLGKDPWRVVSHAQKAAARKARETRKLSTQREGSAERNSGYLNKGLAAPGPGMGCASDSAPS